MIHSGSKKTWREGIMDQKFRYALIGCGKVAKKHIRAILHNKDLVEMVALVDTNEEAMKTFLAQSALSKEQKARIACYTDYRKMLEEQAPAIVSITTPSGTHAKNRTGCDPQRRQSDH